MVSDFDRMNEMNVRPIIVRTLLDRLGAPMPRQPASGILAVKTAKERLATGWAR